MAVEPDKLTERETEVLGLVGFGYPDKTIAAALHISENTVSNHMASILDKLDAVNRTHAYIKWRDNEVVEKHYSQAQP